VNAWMLRGVAILSGSVWQIWWGWASRARPSIQGRIESITIRRTQGGRGLRRRVHVKYDYAVDGTTFRASFLRYRYFGSLFTDADDVANSYPPDLPVTVHHHPRRPSMSVLEPGFDRANLAFSLGVTVAIFAFAYFMSI
jgi:hypothetical protein